MKERRKGKKVYGQSSEINSAPAGGRVWGERKKIAAEPGRGLVLSESTRTALEPAVGSSGTQESTLITLCSYVPSQVPSPLTPRCWLVFHGNSALRASWQPQARRSKCWHRGTGYKHCTCEVLVRIAVAQAWPCLRSKGTCQIQRSAAGCTGARLKSLKSLESHIVKLAMSREMEPREA